MVASLLFVIVHAHILGVVIDRARVVRHLHLRPSIGEVVLFTHVGYKSVANKLNRFHVHGAHGLGGRFNRFTGVHRLSGSRSGSQRNEGNEKKCKKPKLSHHLALFMARRKSTYVQAQSGGQIVCFMSAVCATSELQDHDPNPNCNSRGSFHDVPLSSGTRLRPYEILSRGDERGAHCADLRSRRIW